MRHLSACKNLLQIFILLSLSLLIYPKAFSQDAKFAHRVDSLKSALNQASGVTRQHVLHELAYEYLRVNDSIALPYSEQAFNMSWQYGDSLRIVKSGRIRAQIFKELDEIDSAITLCLKVLPIARRNNYVPELKSLLNVLGLGYLFKAEYDKALAFNLESLELRKKQEDRFSISIALNNTGLVYYKMKSYQRALDYFQHAIEYCLTEGKLSPGVDKDYYEGSLLNISLCHAFLNNLIMAEEYIDKVSGMCEDGCSDYILMQTYYGSGVIKFKQGNDQDALKKFSASLSLAKKLRNERYELDNIIYLSQLSLASNQLTLAEKYLGEAEALMKRGIPFNLELVKIYNELFQLYEKLGDYKKVAFYQAKYIQLNDSIYSEEVTTNLMKIEAEYMERENQAKIETQDKILALQNDVIIRQRIINIFIGVAAALSIILVFVLVQNVKQKKRANISLEHKVKERTMALETHKIELLNLLDERNQQMKRISMEIKSSVATIQGLCKLSLQDVSVVNAAEYIDRIEKTSHNLQSGIHRTLGMNESTLV
jgi:tetratricopeptide (TPR) repeat protein